MLFSLAPVSQALTGALQGASQGEWDRRKMAEADISNQSKLFDLAKQRELYQSELDKSYNQNLADAQKAAEARQAAIGIGAYANQQTQAASDDLKRKQELELSLAQTLPPEERGRLQGELDRLNLKLSSANTNLGIFNATSGLDNLRFNQDTTKINQQAITPFLREIAANQAEAARSGSQGAASTAIAGANTASSNVITSEAINNAVSALSAKTPGEQDTFLKGGGLTIDPSTGRYVDPISKTSFNTPEDAGRFLAYKGLTISSVANSGNTESNLLATRAISPQITQTTATTPTTPFTNIKGMYQGAENWTIGGKVPEYTIGSDNVVRVKMPGNYWDGRPVQELADNIKSKQPTTGQVSATAQGANSKIFNNPYADVLKVPSGVLEDKLADPQVAEEDKNNIRAALKITKPIESIVGTQNNADKYSMLMFIQGNNPSTTIPILEEIVKNNGAIPERLKNSPIVKQLEGMRYVTVFGGSPSVVKDRVQISNDLIKALKIKGGQ